MADTTTLKRKQEGAPTAASTPNSAAAIGGDNDAKRKHVEDSYRNCHEPEDAACVNAIRVLAPAMPSAANSGHPGAPMGCAVIAQALWGHEMNYSPANPRWANRDRFVLSNGHGCALQYLMLHLTGYKLSVEDLKKFRQLNSITPGHPEAGVTPGIEVTTGPLGQGVSQAVGLAIAQERLAAEFNVPESEEFARLIDHYTYCVVGDGCLQEGVSSEAASLAGHLGLGKLIVFYDDNQITIDGRTDLSWSEQVCKRFEAYGWQVLWVTDGDYDIAAIREAIKAAKAETTKPTLIGVRTTIGYGSAKQGSQKVHGAPLSVDDIKALRTKVGLPTDDLWQIPEDVQSFLMAAGEKGNKRCAEWNALLDKYTAAHADKAKELKRRLAGELVEGWQDKLPRYTPDDKPNATRNLSEIALNAISDMMPELIGGSADLTESVKTNIKNSADFTKDCRKGNYIRFGVREHAMVAVCNGLFAYGGFRPYAATFMNFITYAWGALRLSALSHFGVLQIATHDSIDLGEDGPTHQPIETAALVRATPGMLFLRPCDGNEVSGCYAAWMKHPTRPAVMALSRSNCPHLPSTCVDATQRGAYILADFDSSNTTGRKICLAGSGTEVQYCFGAAEILKTEGHNVRVVSMPCWELFNEEPAEHIRSVIPLKSEAVCAYIEPYSPVGISKYFDEAASVFMSTFGASGPNKDLAKHFGFTAENFAEKVSSFIKAHPN